MHRDTKRSLDFQGNKNAVLITTMKVLILFLSLFMFYSCSSTRSTSANIPKSYKDIEWVQTLEPLKGLEIFQYKHRPSGLDIYLAPQQNSDAVAYITSFGVGSRNEIKGRTGLAHLFEHMMFRGTKSYPRPFETLANWGGSFNAYTSFDLTLYYEVVPSELINDVAHFESERMRYLAITPEGYTTERRAVISERKMNYQDRPSGKLYWELYQLGFDDHPYKTTPIGWQKDLDATSFEDALNFYKKYYAPNRAHIAIAGGFKIKEALKIIDKHYGDFQAQPWEEPSIPQEKFHTQLRRKVFPMKTESVLLYDAVAGSQFNSDTVAADLLGCFLFADSTHGYLAFELIEKGLAKSTGSDCSPNIDQALSLVTVQANPSVSVDRIEKAYDKARSQFSKWLTQEKLEQAKLFFLGGQWAELRNPSSLAEEIARSAVTAKDPLYSFKTLEKIKTTTLQDIQNRWESRFNSGHTRVIARPQ